jgi:hypothetical protein
MGYNIHITRKSNWFDEQGDEISLTEWLAYVDSDPEMRLDGHAEANLDGGSVFRIVDSSMAVWIQHPQHGKREGMAWLWLSRGNVLAKNPDEVTLRKMLFIATTLGARVQGDEGEYYDSAILAMPHYEGIDEQQTEQKKKPWWRVW